MGQKQNGIASAINGALEKLEEKARESLSPSELRKKYRAMLVRLLAKMHAIGLQLNEQKSGTIMHGVIIALLEPMKVSKNGELELGIPVTVIKSEELSDMVGKKGYVLTEPNEEGETFIASADGAVGHFKWDSDPEKSELAIDLVPESRVLLSVAGRLIDVPIPKDIKLAPGDCVRVAAQTHAILEKVSYPKTGDICVIKRILDEKTVEVMFGDVRKVVVSGNFHKDLTIGRRVLLDPTGSIVVKDLGDPDSDFHLSEETGVSWDDIGGLEEPKEILQDTIDLPTLDPEVFEYYKGEVPQGMIMIGPPGGGKGMLALAYATALGVRYGEKVPRGYIHVNAPDLLEGIVGASEGKIKDLFDEGNRLFDELGYSVICIDEIDAVGKKRGTGVSSDVNDTIVPALLTALNKFKGTFICLTNRVDILDPALIRSGRIDLKIIVPRPNEAASVKIFQVHLKDIPCHNASYNGLAVHATDLMFSDEFSFFRFDLVKKKDSDEKNSMLFTLGHICSGAMIKAIVNEAKRIAIKRDIAASKKTGVTKEDIELAVRKEFEQNVPLDHLDAMKEFKNDLTEDVLGVKKLRQSTI